MAEDILLSGGNSAASVVLRGETVLKPPTPFDTATTLLLKLFADEGLSGVPRSLGTAEDGRRMLSWAPGTTDFPSDMWQNMQTLISAAQLLRRVHDASVSLVSTDLTWAYDDPDPHQYQVICHNDFAPYNMAFAADGTVTGVFDFDLAGRGPRLRDLAYLAWWMVPLGRSDPDMAAAAANDLSDGSPRLKKVQDTYGSDECALLLNTVGAVLAHMANPTIAAKMIGQPAADRLQIGGHFDHWAQAAADFERDRPRLAANLGLSDHD